MVEGGGHEISEEEFLGAVEFAHEAIKKIVAAIDKLAKKAGKKKRACSRCSSSIRRSMRGCARTFKKDVAESDAHSSRKANATLRSRSSRAMRRSKKSALKTPTSRDLSKTRTTKTSTRSSRRWRRKNSASWSSTRRFVPTAASPTRSARSGRKSAICRAFTAPASFTRGQTQVLTAATLGSIGDEQRLDGIMAIPNKRYMHYYNFPPYSVGETRPMRGPGRREIGHGHLAERALVPILPPQEEFPYTMRLISEVLESNGSSSMASVCGSTLALMDAGVPIQKHVAGVAMGLVINGKKARDPHRHPGPRRFARRDGLQGCRNGRRHHRDSDGHQGRRHHDRHHARSDGRSEEVAPVHHQQTQRNDARRARQHERRTHRA